MRRGWKRGDWLVRDEESGFTEYASEVRRDYYGVLTKTPDRAHPQDFIRAKNDPFIYDPQNPPTYIFDTSALNLGDLVGVTSVSAPIGPATHLFNPNAVNGDDPGVGSMTIGTTFRIR